MEGQHLRRARRAEAEDGAVVVEFAVVFVLFIALLWGIVTYGVIFAAQQTLTHAAAESARATVGHGSFEEARTVATSVATGQLDWLGGSATPTEGDVRLGDCVSSLDEVFDPDGYEASVDGEKCVFVQYEYPWHADPIIPPISYVGTPPTIRGTAVITWEGN